jgi:hypothetical protein
VGGGMIPYSAGHLLKDAFLIVSLFTVILAYITAKTIIDDENVARSKIIIIIASICATIGPIARILHSLKLWDYTPTLYGHPIHHTLWYYPAFIASLLIAYTSVRHPETLLISKVQIIRAQKLYKIVESLESEKKARKFGMPSLIAYLKKVQPDILAGQPSKDENVP